jgi:hypothetical protein
MAAVPPGGTMSRLPHSEHSSLLRFTTNESVILACTSKVTVIQLSVPDRWELIQHSVNIDAVELDRTGDSIHILQQKGMCFPACGEEQ